MTLSKIVKLTFFLIFVLSTFPVTAQSHLKICLTSKVVKNLPSYGQSFLNGAYLARMQSEKGQDVEVKNYFYNNRALEPIYVYKKMVQDKCSAIIGFEYLSDLLLVIKNQKNEKIPIFTSYPSITHADKVPPNIFIFMPTYDFLADKMLKFLYQRFKIINGVLIATEVNRDEMRKYESVYSSKLTKRNVKFDTFYFLENDNNVEEKLNKIINGKKYNFVFLLSGAIAAAKIANVMNDHHIIFVGTENYGSSTSQTFFLRLKDKNIRSYFIRNLDFLKTSSALSNFEKDYTDIYHTKPILLSAYTYDATTMILKAYNETGSVCANCIFHINYKGITGIYLKNRKFNSSKNYVILSVSKNGYKYEE